MHTWLLLYFTHKFSNGNIPCFRTTASQLIQSSEEVKHMIVTDRISHVLLFSVVQVFLNRPYFYSKMCKEAAVQLCTLPRFKPQEWTRNRISTCLHDDNFQFGSSLFCQLKSMQWNYFFFHVYISICICQLHSVNAIK